MPIFARGLAITTGHLETLYSDGDSGFLEMNTRIQVEHGVTEDTGIDLVQQQILLSAGADLPAQPSDEGSRYQCAFTHQSAQTLMPSAGMLRSFDMPKLFGVRVETGYQQGQEVSPYYDALASIIATGSTREQAIGRVVVALQAFTIEGVRTNSLAAAGAEVRPISAG